MQALTRRGFTLPELLIALLLFGMIGLAIYKVLLTDQRLYQAQTQRVDLQQNLRAAVNILTAELRQLDASEGDIKAMFVDSIRIRGMRQLAFICQIPVLGGALTGLTMTVRGSGPDGVLFFGPRNYSKDRDSLLVYYEGGVVTRVDDAWLLADLTAITPQNCPNGSPGQSLTFTIITAVTPIPANVAGNITVGSPVWGFEGDVVYKAYKSPSDQKWYIGLRDSSGTQPVVGPLTDSTGLAFTYYDRNGAITAVPANVALIQVRVAGQTAQTVFKQVGSPSNPVDTMTTWVGLRNNLRW